MMRLRVTTLLLWLAVVALGIAPVRAVEDTTPTLATIPQLERFHSLALQLKAAYDAQTTAPIHGMLFELARLNSEISTQTEDLALRVMMRATTFNLEEQAEQDLMQQVPELVHSATVSRYTALVGATEYMTSGDARYLTTATLNLATARADDFAMAELLKPYESRVQNVVLPAAIVPIFQNAFAGLSGQTIAVPVEISNLGTQNATGVKAKLFRDDRKKNNEEEVEIGTVPARGKVVHVYFMKLDKTSRVISLTITLTSTNAPDIVNQTTIIVDDVL